MRKLRNYTAAVCLFLLFSLIFTAMTVGLADFFIPDSLSVFEDEEAPLGRIGTLEDMECVAVGQFGTTATATVRLLGVLPIKRIEVNTFRRLSLCPGGEVFGIRIALGGAMVTGLSEVTPTAGEASSPGKEAGLRRGDLVTEVDGVSVSGAAVLTEAIASSGGRPLRLTVKRGKENLTITVTPIFSASAGGYRCGIWIKDTAAGIGTVTFVDPHTGAFGGLGHGIYDTEAGRLLPLSRGTVMEVGLTGVSPGAAGDPGELRGHLTDRKTGSLLSNTDCGVFGVFSSPRVSEGDAIPIALSDAVVCGPAEILCTLHDGERRKYGIEITEIRGGSSMTKSFAIKVTDPALLNETGGIVQGMSGSPILQNGCLIGAVTHVMINDPTAGYGIFIENMLRSMPESIRP